MSDDFAIEEIKAPAYLAEKVLTSLKANQSKEFVANLTNEKMIAICSTFMAEMIKSVVDGEKDKICFKNYLTIKRVTRAERTYKVPTTDDDGEKGDPITKTKPAHYALKFEISPKLKDYIASYDIEDEDKEEKKNTKTDKKVIAVSKASSKKEVPKKKSKKDDDEEDEELKNNKTTVSKKVLEKKTKKTDDEEEVEVKKNNKTTKKISPKKEQNKPESDVEDDDEEENDGDDE